jgi:ApbE superfamily uncharacterized protein (UPF0280 family)
MRTPWSPENYPEDKEPARADFVVLSSAMNSRAQIAMLPDGHRLHLHDGPIDLIVEAFGSAPEVETAYRAACARFVTVLDELCAELAHLRQACRPEQPWPDGAVARRMVAAVMPYTPQYFITPMAAVAGAVAQEILAAMVATAEVSRAYVNDGGDIALHLNDGEKFTIGMVERPDRPSLFGKTAIAAHDPVRGIATSGWRGRSFSLGIADAVTVLADRAAAADAAATIIANAVDLPRHPSILRVPACELAPDSDLGDRPVTQAVGTLSNDEVEQALAAGARTAELLLRMGLIRAAAICLQGNTRVVGTVGGLKLVEGPEHERILLHA